MSIPTYTLGYPPDGASLGQTKSTMRNNLDGTFETLGIDHVNNNGQTNNGFSSKPAGYHNIVHMVPQGSDPQYVSGYGQLYSKIINSGGTTDTSLFWETSAGVIQQLTSNLTPSANTNGYTYLPGGIIIQWGQVVIVSSPQTIAFPFTFPNAVFSVVTGVNTNAVSTANTSTNAISNTGFQFYTTKTGSTNFYIAIGN